jgi:hypothetical protein
MHLRLRLVLGVDHLQPLVVLCLDQVLVQPHPQIHFPTGRRAHSFAARPILKVPQNFEGEVDS